MSFDPSARADTHFAAGTAGRFAYRRAGPSGSTPLVLCQRFRGTLDDWDPAFLDVLAEERDVVVFDSAGVGASSGTVSPTVAGMADAAFDFLSAVDLSEVDLLGWSMGGFIAQRMALERPELVRRLIIAGSKPGLVPDAPAPTPEVGQVAGKAMNDIEDFLYLFFPETVKGAKLAWRRWLAFRGPPKRLG